MRSTPSSPARGMAAADIVSSDFAGLATHLHTCNRSRGRFFVLQSTLEYLHSQVSPRIVTTATAFAATGIVVLFALA